MKEPSFNPLWFVAIVAVVGIFVLVLVLQQKAAIPQETENQNLLGKAGTIPPGDGRTVPSITGLSGTFTQGSAVTITGSGFGIKNPVAPYKFDSFDEGSGSLGQVIDPSASGGRDWEMLASCATGGIVIPSLRTRYSNTYMRYAGDVVGWKHFGYNTDNHCFQGTNYLTLTKDDGYDEIYWSMWVLSGTNGQYDKVRNIKIASWDHNQYAP
jgi:hypothetical protein